MAGFLDSRFAREGAAIAMGQGVTAIGRLVGLRLLTELVAPGVFGEVALLLGLGVLGVNLFCAPFTQAAIRFYPEAVRERRVAALRALLIRLLAPRTAAIAVLIPLGGAAWIGLAGPDVAWIGVAAVSAVVVLDVARSVEISLLSAARKHTESAIWYAADACLRPALAVLMVLLVGPTPASVLVGYSVAIAISTVALRGAAVRGAPAQEPSGDDGWSAPIRADVMRYAAPLVPLALVGWVLQLSDRYILAVLASAEQTGIYAAAYGLASMPFTVGAGSIQLLLRPVLNDAISRGDRAAERRTVLLWLALSGALLLTLLAAVALLAGPIVRLALGEEYWGGAELLPWVGAAYVVWGGQLVFEGMIHAQRRTGRLLVMQSVAAVTVVAGCFALIPSMGAKGAAAATLAAMCASCACGVVLSGFVPRILLGRADPGSA